MLIRLPMTLTIVTFFSTWLSAIISLRFAYSLVSAKSAHVVSRSDMQPWKLSNMGNVGLFVDACGLVVDGVDDFEFEVFGIILVCHVAGDDALK